MNSRHILITESDMSKLRKLLDLRMGPASRDQHHLEMLARELERAEVVRSEEIPPDVVTMNSHVRVRDLDAGKDFSYTLVFPEAADISEGRISVLAPIGTALLGYREGDEIEWIVPGGMRRIRVVEVLYQPEAEGDEPGPESASCRAMHPVYREEGPRSQGKLRTATK